MLKTLKGTNALTVLFSPTEDGQKTRMFFCPYRKNIVGSYQGKVVSINPGYNPDYSPQFYVRPQRQRHEDNIHYIFVAVDKEDTTTFWVQNQYFDDRRIKDYYCYNCQAPQMYFNDKGAVSYNDKKQLTAGDNYTCTNCGEESIFMGIVNIRRPDGHN